MVPLFRMLRVLCYLGLGRHGWTTGLACWGAVGLWVPGGMPCAFVWGQLRPSFQLKEADLWEENIQICKGFSLVKNNQRSLQPQGQHTQRDKLQRWHGNCCPVPVHQPRLKLGGDRLHPLLARPHQLRVYCHQLVPHQHLLPLPQLCKAHAVSSALGEIS